MREIEISQFNNSTELEEYFNSFARSGFSTQFFQSYNTEDEIIFIDQFRKKAIRIFEYDYLIPYVDCRKDNDGDMALSSERDIVLSQYKGKGVDIEPVRRAVLMFVNPYGSELAVHDGNILVDAQRKSAIFTGSFTLQKLFNFIQSGLFDEVKEIYVFPYHNGMPDVNSPFHQDKYLKLSISKEVKVIVCEHKDARIREIMQKTCF